jgi:2-C-methyl-D-erythritol 4-phosphate cytidylyltransferase/2-C-methyl-D-erythritol 2,4-cyclodiphosphate synthase
MTAAAIIVAAGRGTRAGGPLPKQWQELAGRPVIDWTLDAFRALPEIGRIVAVLHPSELDRARAWPDVTAVAGGSSRAESVRAGLEALAGDPPRHVLIHDAARPLVTQEVILAVLAALAEHRAAAPGLPVTDALWRVEEGFVTGTVDRRGVWRAQTPQGFHFDAILAAHRALSPAEAAGMADDVAVARAAGLAVAAVPGDERNLKITRPEDFARAEALMGAEMDVRTGNGFDVHRFGPGDHVRLCGVSVPHDRGLIGHSDADVALHALTDAVLGALALGDIGSHFPPSDPRWKGADSSLFLARAVELATERGYAVTALDVTIICELPRIGPHVAAMRARIAAIAGVDESRVSVKATTTERLGFAGRGEGIAALATATVVAP